MSFISLSRILEIVDTICMIYFTLEYAVRFSCAPKKLRFVMEVYMKVIGYCQKI